ncbi:AraC family transcriptional regulator [Nocardioides campestrisoli]|uniref:AraC family transcriptional regulator n=1 Tax=Nocardioides campestrisoli TaxID=2736757 RepID=UPI00163DB683|nr:helix-turn-helix domain-containing protein [Nocardioides campestrisoli]
MGGVWGHPPAARVPASLRPYVDAMFGYSADGLTPGVHRGLPSHGLTLVLSLEQPLRTAPSEEDWARGVRDAQWVSLGGLHTRAAMVENPGRWLGVQLTLHPLGARGLLGAPAAALPVGSWDARDLLGAEVDRVVEELHAATDWADRYAAVLAFLGRRRRAVARGAEPPVPRPEVRHAWRLLTREPARPVQAVAAEVGYSRRRLGQLLAAEVGHGPKTVQRLARFDAARRAVARASSAGDPLAQVAARVGYYDQSHLVRDFHEFAGLGPTAWLAAERGAQEFPNLQVGQQGDGAA